MIINLEKNKKIKKLKKRLEYIEECLDCFNDINKSSLNKGNINKINKIIQKIFNSSTSKREFSLFLKNKFKENNINVTYKECKVIYDYLQIGHKKIYLKGYFAYYKLINNH